MHLTIPRRWFGSGASISIGGVLTPAQALVASFASSPGLVDALLLFDPAHYSTPGSTPGHLVDALGGPITYTAPNTQATPTAVQDASGYCYASADGVDDTLIASANQAVAWYCAVFRSPPGQSVWSSYGPPLGDDAFKNYFSAGDTNWDPGQGLPRGVSRNGSVLASPFHCSPITDWMTLSVLCDGPTDSVARQLFAFIGNFFTQLHLAALAIRYTDPTSDQQLAIEARLLPIQQALFFSSLFPLTDDSGDYYLTDDASTSLLYSL